MKEVKTTVKLKKDGTIYVPIQVIKLLDANPGDLLEVILRKED